MEYFMDDSDDDDSDVKSAYKNYINNRINIIKNTVNYDCVKNIKDGVYDCSHLLSNITNIWETLQFKFNQINRVITYISIDRVKFKSSGKSENDAKLKAMKKVLQYLSEWTDLSDSVIVKTRYPTIHKILDIRDKFLYNQLNEIEDKKDILNPAKSKYIYYIQIGEHKYYGRGSTMQTAKSEAAAAVFANIPDSYDVDSVERNNNNNNNNNKQRDKIIPKYSSCQNLMSTKNGNILALLYNVRNQLEFYTNIINNELFELYNTTVTIDGKPFEGSGPDEISAKRNAMEKLLIYIQNKKISISRSSKSMMLLLYRIRSGLIYNHDVWKRKHDNQCISYIRINGDIYTGTGKDEQSANLTAAANVFISPNNFAKDIYKNTTISSDSPVPVKEKLSNVESHDKKPIQHQSKESSTNASENTKQIGLMDFEQLPKTLADINPMELLQSQLKTRISYSLDSNYLQTFNKFKAIAIVDNIEYIGYGPCGQIAREEAAKNALLKLCNLKYKHNELSEHFVETIEKLIMEKFIELKSNNNKENDMIACHRLSAIVMTKDLNLSTAKIVAITSGSQNVYGGLMSMNGTVLYDTHCEILIRRCLLKYFYDHLKMFNTKGLSKARTTTIIKNSIFERSTNNKKMYKLKNNIQFHLYISDAPCGIIISDEFKRNNHQSDKLNLKYPLNGDNKLPANNVKQTWSNIIKGDQLLNMSCSDKISKWNVVGVQGALLSNIIEPVYFYSIILGKSKYLIDIHRITIGRFANGLKQSLPSPYHINNQLKLAETIPLTTVLHHTSKDDGDDDDDHDHSSRYYSTNILSLHLNKHFISQYAFNWTAAVNKSCSNKNNGEVINLLTGLLHNEKISSISKLALFNEYINVIKKLPNINANLLNNLNLNYGDVKLLANDYQKSKIIIYKLLADNKLGNWPRKPKEIYDFSMDTKFF